LTKAPISIIMSARLSTSVNSPPAINKDYHEKSATVVDLGYSDHGAQILCLYINTYKS